MRKLKIYLRPFLNIRVAVCFFVAWMITNGWSYVFVVLGKWMGVKWMFNIGMAWLMILWLPMTPEKIITIPIALLLHRWWFKDEKSRKVLEDFKAEAKKDWKRLKSKFKKD